MSQPDCGFSICRMNGRYVFLFKKYGATYQVELKMLPATKNSRYTTIETYTVTESNLENFINTTVAGYSQ